MEKNVGSVGLYLGVPALDGPHEELLAELARLDGLPDSELGTRLFDVIARLERDFRAEEELMEAAEFPGLALHREQHARALSGLHHVVPRVMNGDIACGREAVELLRHWFAFHVSTTDAVLAVALRSAGQTSVISESPAPALGLDDFDPSQADCPTRFLLSALRRQIAALQNGIRMPRPLPARCRRIFLMEG